MDDYVARQKRWGAEVAALRERALSTGLEESLKWGVPCYSLSGGNVVLIHVFKEYCAILFFKGALLTDPEGRLVQQTKNVQAARQLRFTSVDEVRDARKLIDAFLIEAIELERSGAKVEPKKTADFVAPEEWTLRLSRSPSLKKAFAALTPGRQRAYLLFFSGAKLSETRAARIAKSEKAILAGKGLDD